MPLKLSRPKNEYTSEVCDIVTGLLVIGKFNNNTSNKLINIFTRNTFTQNDVKNERSPFQCLFM